MFDSKSKIKVLIIGRDNVTRKYFVDHDAQFYADKYRVDPDAIVQTIEGGFLGVFSSQVPTIIFRENSIEPISKKHPGTIPTPQEFGENVNRAANAIAVLRAKKDDGMHMVTMILVIIAVIAAAASCYCAYSDGKKIDTLQTSVNTLTAQISTYQSQQTIATNQTAGGMVFDPASGAYRPSGG